VNRGGANGRTPAPASPRTAAGWPGRWRESRVQTARPRQGPRSKRQRRLSGSRRCCTVSIGMRLAVRPCSPPPGSPRRRRLPNSTALVAPGRGIGQVVVRPYQPRRAASAHGVAASHLGQYLPTPSSPTYQRPSRRRHNDPRSQPERMLDERGHDVLTRRVRSSAAPRLTDLEVSAAVAQQRSLTDEQCVRRERGRPPCGAVDDQGVLSNASCVGGFAWRAQAARTPARVPTVQCRPRRDRDHVENEEHQRATVTAVSDRADDHDSVSEHAPRQQSARCGHTRRSSSTCGEQQRAAQPHDPRLPSPVAQDRRISDGEETDAPQHEQVIGRRRAGSALTGIRPAAPVAVVSELQRRWSSRPGHEEHQHRNDGQHRRRQARLQGAGTSQAAGARRRGSDAAGRTVSGGGRRDRTEPAPRREPPPPRRAQGRLGSCRDRNLTSARPQ
jgi:hypothetical protein